MFCKKTQRCKKRIWGLSNPRFRTSPVIFFLGLLIFAAACRTNPITCDDRLGCVVVRPNSPIRLATLLPISGETAVWGQDLARGVDLALADRANKLLDHEIELIALDSACDPDSGQQAIQALNGDETLLGIIGPGCSDVAQTVLPTVRRNNWLLISPAATAPTLTETQSDTVFFRTVPNHLHQATVAAHFAYDVLGVRRTAVFQDETAFNSLLAQQFSDTFSQLGGTVSSRGSLAIGQIDLDTLLAETAVTPPELIYLALFEPEANLLINRLSETSRLSRAALLGGDSLLTTGVALGSSTANADLFVTGPLLDSDAYRTFLDKWAIRYDTELTTSAPAYAYDATQLLLSAIEDVAVVGETGTLVIGRAALRARLAATDGVAGLTGTLRCDPGGDCAASGYGVYEMDTAVRSNAVWPPPLIWQFE